MIRLIYILSIISFSTFCWGQQELLNTQFSYNKLGINPAAAGIENYTVLTLMVRDQWNGLEGAPTRQQFGLSVPFTSKRVGLGIIGERNTIGIQERLALRAMYAYRFKLGPGMLNLGMEASARRYTVDYTDSRLLAIDGVEQDPELGFRKYNSNTFNTGIGLYYKLKKFYAGFSSPSLLNVSFDEENESSFTRERRHLYIMTGSVFEINREWNFTAQALFKIAENSPYDLDLQAGMIFKNEYHIGLNYRLGGDLESAGESIAILLGLEPLPTIFFGFSYDFTMSAIRDYETGSLEAVLIYSIGKKRLKESIINPRYF